MPRDAEATRDRILAAAFDEFTERGFAGARVDEIARRAKANKALLYQYCGAKEVLFRQVLEWKMAELANLQHDPTNLPESAGRFFDFHAANPWLTRLMQWEALDFGAEGVPNETERARRWAGHVEQLEQAQTDGHVEASLDPRHTLVTLVGMITFWFAAPQVARMICGGDPYAPDALAERRAHIVEMARRLLEA